MNGQSWPNKPAITSEPVTAIRANAKLTLSLRIVGVRSDGYHLIDAEMVTLDLSDSLTVEAGDGLEVVDLTVDREGVGPAGVVPTGAENLISRALELAGTTAFVHLTKRIPAGAGLGGGSADAAAVLRWAGFTDLERAASVGADVPFCLTGGRARVRGIGERVDPLPYRKQVFTLVIPPLRCPTPAVYAAWDGLGGPSSSSGNDLEPAALQLLPELARYRDRLGEETGRTPMLAGSGSSWFVEGAYPGEGRLVVRATPPGR
ncbi:MAG: 4-diphosphocytidyl-2-C-methyl-D-erythritol kinase [Acidimicrobiales bacterium]|nr:MAG: 4-(cytidine 5'-diphospho)-2-C-methyl-D-erythritol kinase [Actinomycetota bacterium]MBV6507790.1 4-diphosphocytidyl-2-C-methyl-D-erythritol kinase [Acidimicrobiales bacterium]RIK05948.1 MAG: 4-(cytidine 5'-diphospho)-2-C-methyl-D-erythritol kinase [Acidobacteriota bacterium]